MNLQTKDFFTPLCLHYSSKGELQCVIYCSLLLRAILFPVGKLNANALKPYLPIEPDGFELQELAIQLKKDCYSHGNMSDAMLDWINDIDYVVFDSPLVSFENKAVLAQFILLFKLRKLNLLTAFQNVKEKRLEIRTTWLNYDLLQRLDKSIKVNKDAIYIPLTTIQRLIDTLQEKYPPLLPQLALDKQNYLL
jgi:hypothetical protein